MNRSPMLITPKTPESLTGTTDYKRLARLALHTSFIQDPSNGSWHIEQSNYAEAPEDDVPYFLDLNEFATASFDRKTILGEQTDGTVWGVFTDAWPFKKRLFSKKYSALGVTVSAPNNGERNMRLQECQLDRQITLLTMKPGEKVIMIDHATSWRRFNPNSDDYLLHNLAVNNGQFPETLLANKIFGIINDRNKIGNT